VIWSEPFDLTPSPLVSSTAKSSSTTRSEVTSSPSPAPVCPLNDKHRLAGAGALHLDIVDVERQALGQVEAAGADLTVLARLPP
jgi:hypothetical protein